MHDFFFEDFNNQKKVQLFTVTKQKWKNGNLVSWRRNWIDNCLKKNVDFAPNVIFFYSFSNYAK